MISLENVQEGVVFEGLKDFDLTNIAKVLLWKSNAEAFTLKVTKDIDDYRDCLNPDSLIEVSSAVVEPSVLEGSNERFQFEREGYFCKDVDPTATGRSVFNRTITLRDSWAG